MDSSRTPVLRRIVRGGLAVAAAGVLATGLAVGLAVAPASALATAAPADTTTGAPDLDWSATIDGRDVAAGTSNNPIPLRGGRDAEVTLSVSNTGAQEVDVHSVRLQGRVIGMSFFTFTTRVDLSLQPGATQERTIQLDLGELDDQATGLIPARMSLLDPDREVLVDRRLATDVRGSVISAYGVFGLAIAAITLFLIIGLALEIARHQLPVNRWRRAVRFLGPGLGIGLTATFTLSATRLLIPSATVWVPLVLGCGAIAFAIGYLTPTPDEDLRGDEDAYAAAQQPHPTPASQVLDVRERQPALEPDAGPPSRPRTQ